MKTMLMLPIVFFLVSGLSHAQKPDWVDNPGQFSEEYFTAIGLEDDVDTDDAREDAEKEARKAMEKTLRGQYDKDLVKQAMAHAFVHGYWDDPDSDYSYALLLLKREKIDQTLKAEKGFTKSKSSALDAVKDLRDVTADDDEEEKDPLE